VTVLAIDTCFGACSVALRLPATNGDWVIREDYRELATGHAEVLMPMIEGLMTASDIAFTGLGKIAVTIGPGSFTGLRIGLSAARGFRAALGLPVVTLTSLMVMAYRADTLFASGQFPVARAGTTLAVCVDARGGRIYAEAFGDDVSEPVTTARLTTPTELAETLRKRRVIAVGSGAAMLADAIGGDAVALLPNLQPHARQLAMLCDAAPLDRTLAPLYLRETDAKPMAAP
jgi:tRNA threonylcarbamoyladenosine biosynthesis protein TsaB